MSDLIVGLNEDWLWLDERIESITGEIEMISKAEANCQRLMSVRDRPASPTLGGWT